MVLSSCGYSDQQLYRTFDVSTINGIYSTGAGSALVRMRLQVVSDSLISSWIMYRGKKRLIHGTMTDTKDMSFHFIAQEDSINGGGVKYTFTLYGSNHKFEGNNYLIEGERYTHNGLTKRFFLISKIWSDASGHTSDYNNSGDIWADSLGELSFYEMPSQKVTPHYVHGDTGFYENFQCYYVPYPALTEDIDVPGVLENFGKCYMANDLFIIHWSNKIGFQSDASSFRKIYIQTADTAYYILKNKERTFYLIKSANILDSI